MNEQLTDHQIKSWNDLLEAVARLEKDNITLRTQNAQHRNTIRDFQTKAQIDSVQLKTATGNSQVYQKNDAPEVDVEFAWWMFRAALDIRTPMEDYEIEATEKEIAAIIEAYKAQQANK